MRGVRHDVTAEGFDKCYARILASARTVRPALVIRFGFQCDTEAFDSDRVAGLIK
jgi:hypothetical protein